MLRIETLDGQVAFAPGEPIDGVVTWDLDQPASGLQLNLIWYTTGRGTRNDCVVLTERFDDPPAADVRSFSFTAPPGPYSVAGRMIGLSWALELVARRRNKAARLDITIGPGRREVDLRDLVVGSAS